MHLSSHTFRFGKYIIEVEPASGRFQPRIRLNGILVGHLMTDQDFLQFVQALQMADSAAHPVDNGQAVR